jgi:hypothetical protein
MGPTAVRSRRARFLLGFAAESTCAFSPPMPPARCATLARARLTEKDFRRAFFFSDSRSTAHPSAAFTRAVRPQMRALASPGRSRARGTMRSRKTNLRSIAIGMTTQSAFSLENAHSRRGAKEAKSNTIARITSGTLPSRTRRRGRSRDVRSFSRRRRRAMSSRPSSPSSRGEAKTSKTNPAREEYRKNKPKLTAWRVWRRRPPSSARLRRRPRRPPRQKRCSCARRCVSALCPGCPAR